jgi:membrane-bound lytic murein transglycosylase A
VAGAGVVASTDITTAAGQTLRRGPSIATLPIAPDDARAALTAFRLTCPSVTKRQDASGLTRPEDWRAPCAAAAGWPDADAARFFVEQLEAVQVGEGAAFATGYFEPEIAGSRVRTPGFDVPVYGRPSDLVDVDLSQFSPEWAGKRVRGKLKGSDLVPYDDRTQIEQGTLNGRAPVIAWAADAIEFFFLQVQGSGRLRAPDGSVVRIGYASQNGRDYTGIGALMRERGLLAPGQASMQGIVAYLRANPEEGRAIMRENKSFVFFRELTGPGPLGALGYQVEAGSTVAADPKFVPLGAPVFLSMDRAEPNGLWVAQDTGGAIKGANRYDTFWGAGDRARIIAGGMSARGLALILLPRGSYDRLSRQAR